MRPDVSVFYIFRNCRVAVSMFLRSAFTLLPKLGHSREEHNVQNRHNTRTHNVWGTPPITLPTFNTLQERIQNHVEKGWDACTF